MWGVGGVDWLIKHVIVVHVVHAMASQVRYLGVESRQVNSSQVESSRAESSQVMSLKTDKNQTNHI